ncbi:MAG: c-type cytochrome domain-containing protein [Bacteroidota bacterium]
MNRQATLQSIAMLSSIMLLAAGCKDLGTGPMTGVPAPPGSVTRSFSKDIIPIFQQYGCYQCHGGTNNLDTHTVAGLLRGGDHGPAIVPGNADSSLIMRKTSPTPPFGDRMPQGGPYLPDGVRGVIAEWISQGAKDN